MNGASPKRLRLALGCDDAAVALKDEIRDFLLASYAEEIEVVDSVDQDADDCDYPDVALEIATAVAVGTFDRAILMCGTGIGMAITANKVPGVRAAQAHDAYSAERARKSNDAQILTLGSRVIGVELAKSIVSVWLASDFAGGRSTRKLNKVIAIDKRFRGSSVQPS